MVAPGGLFLLTTPFSWKPEFTPKVKKEEGEERKEAHTHPAMALACACVPCTMLSSLWQERRPKTSSSPRVCG